VDPRIAAVYFGLAAAGAGLILTARALRMRLRWGRRVGLLSLITICVLCVAMGGAAIVLPGEGDGAGYIILGAIELFALAFFGLVTLVRSEEGRSGL
jgi:hypothetical protein